jgi:hypothetical protein
MQVFAAQTQKVHVFIWLAAAVDGHWELRCVLLIVDMHDIDARPLSQACLPSLLTLNLIQAGRPAQTTVVARRR